MNYHNSTTKNLEGSDWCVLQSEPFSGITDFTITSRGLCYITPSSVLNYVALGTALLGRSLLGRVAQSFAI
jgi:hypothetical protein